MATINEVARRAGVSITTVSRILNEDKQLKILDETRQRVLDAVTELGYTPLKKKKKILEKFKLGVIHWYDGQEEIAQPYFLRMRIIAEKMCVEQEIEVVDIYQSEIEQYKHKCDAIVVIGDFDSLARERIGKLSKHILFLDAISKPIKHDSLSFDYKQGIHQALNYLERIGHTQIGYIGSSKYVGEIGAKEQEHAERAFRQYMSKYAGVKDQWVLQGKSTAEDGYRLMNQIMANDHRPTALIMNNSVMCLGAYKALNELGYSVPDNISLISLDSMRLEEYLLPALTCLEGDMVEIVRLSLEMLTEAVRTNRSVPRQVLLPMTLIVRDSCKMIEE